MSKTATAETTRLELVRMRELIKILGLRNRKSVYELRRNDPSFPRPRQITKFSIAWIRAEIDAYLAALPIAELDGRCGLERHGVDRDAVTDRGKKSTAQPLAA